MEFKSRAQAKRLTGLNYLGSVSLTYKHQKSIKFGEYTYSLYLSPGNNSGYEVCPGRTKECSKYCLNESGLNKMSMNEERINQSRIQKTKLFFEDKDFFMNWLVYEINLAKAKAEKKGFKFSVRLNNTSDINPEEFVLNGKNILQIFPDIQFYDYTKVFDRHKLVKKYPNYDLTYSYTGHNKELCKKMLLMGIRVAVVFKKVPTEFWGVQVINGDESDLRYRDTETSIVGLKFKNVREKLTEDVKFVVQ